MLAAASEGQPKHRATDPRFSASVTVTATGGRGEPAERLLDHRRHERGELAECLRLVHLAGHDDEQELKAAQHARQAKEQGAAPRERTPQHRPHLHARSRVYRPRMYSSSVGVLMSKSATGTPVSVSITGPAGPTIENVHSRSDVRRSATRSRSACGGGAGAPRTIPAPRGGGPPGSPRAGTGADPPPPTSALPAPTLSTPPSTGGGT